MFFFFVDQVWNGSWTFFLFFLDFDLIYLLSACAPQKWKILYTKDEHNSQLEKQQQYSDRAHFIWSSVE